MMRRQERLSSVVLVAAAAAALLSQAALSSDELPPGVEQLIERGQIAAVFEPSFVDAREAGIPDDAWVLGVVVDGEAKAYSLNLLNRHEVVNDRIGERSFAAVW